MDRFGLNSFKLWTVIFFVLVFGSFAYGQQNKADLKLKAQEFLAIYEPRLDETREYWAQFSILRYLAPAAYYAGEIEKAKDYTAKMVDLAEKHKSQAGFGPARVADAVHISNIVLGRIVFDDGDIEKAKEHLLAAGKITRGSPTLGSFGPNLYLAKILLEKGERETVIKYFDLCANFWEMEKGRLAKWKSMVEKGELPDFGPSLISQIDVFKVVK